MSSEHAFKTGLLLRQGDSEARSRRLIRHRCVAYREVAVAFRSFSREAKPARPRDLTRFLPCRAASVNVSRDRVPEATRNSVARANQRSLMRGDRGLL